MLLVLLFEIVLSVILKYTSAVDKPGSEKTWYLNETIDDGNKSVAVHVIEDIASFLILSAASGVPGLGAQAFIDIIVVINPII